MTLRPPPRKPSSDGKAFAAVLLWVLLPLALGLGLALLIPRPQIGLIVLDDDIDGRSAVRILDQIDYARTHPEIRAVVLAIDSPGGTVVDTERIYLELHRLRQTKPVVAVIDGMAASGGYYLAVGTDSILALPSSRVGNVGVIGFMPYPPTIFEDPLTTGPYKMWGRTRDAALRQMDVIKQGFVEAVLVGRGEALNVGAETLLRGELWPGTQALQMGLVDALGTRRQAFDEAAALARVAHYRTVDLYDLAYPPEEAEPTPDSPFGAAPAVTETLRAQEREPGLYLLYVPPSERRLP